MGEWQPIESAPRDGSPIVAWDRRSGLEVVWWWHTHWTNDDPIGELCITHWMRPDPPEL